MDMNYKDLGFGMAGRLVYWYDVGMIGVWGFDKRERDETREEKKSLNF